MDEKAQQVLRSLHEASEQVTQELMPMAYALDTKYLPDILSRVNGSAMGFVAFTLDDQGGNVTKKQLQSAIDLSGGDFLPYNSEKFEAALRGEFTPTDPVEIIVINYILDMRGRLDKTWDSINV